MLMATKHTWLTTSDSQHAGPLDPQPFQASKSPEGAPVVQNEPPDPVSSYTTFTEGKEQLTECRLSEMHRKYFTYLI